MTAILQMCKEDTDCHNTERAAVENNLPGKQRCLRGSDTSPSEPGHFCWSKQLFRASFLWNGKLQAVETRIQGSCHMEKVR